MAKKETKEVTEAPVATETKAPGEVPAPENKALASESAKQALVIPEKTLAQQLESLGASPGVVRKAVKASANFALMENPRIPRIKAVGNGLVVDPEATEPAKEFQGLVIYGKKYKAFYAKDWVKGSKEIPDCFSHDSVAPEADVKARQNPTCKGCPKNQFGTAKQGKGKACRDIRQLFVLPNVVKDQESLMPKQLDVTPSSLRNWDDYMGRLVEHGLSFDEVETKVIAKKLDQADPHVVLSFSKVKVYGDENPEEKQVLANVKAITTLWMPFMERQHTDADEINEAEGEAATAPAAAKQGNGDF